MFDRKFPLLTCFAVLMAVVSLHAQSKKTNDSKEKGDPKKSETPAKPAAPNQTGLQWANRDMTYHGKGYDVRDSAYYPKYRLKQFHRYIDHLDAFPPKPRNMWEVGIGGGPYNVIGDIPTLILLAHKKGGGGLSLNVRKSIGYVFSMRVQGIYGVGRNLDRQLTGNYSVPYSIDTGGYFYTPSYLATPQDTTDYIYRYTRTESFQVNMDMMFNLGNISFHQARNKMSFFAYFGVGALGYKTRVNALSDKFSKYNFEAIPKSTDTTNKLVRKALQKEMDKTFESNAATSGGKTIGKNKDKTLDFSPSIGFGVQYKINSEWNVQIEDRYSFPTDQFIDGTRFGANLGTTYSSSHRSDAINYFSVSINFNIKKKQCVEPLYWMNPLDNAFNELMYPRNMTFPNPVLPDKDEDGVSDQFDKCPKTPAGLKVDVHGCPLDTDHDGVPDYLDKQLITPTECQPVNADGIGDCPCPDGCKDIVTNGGDNKNKKNPCGTIGACTLLFPENSNKINKGIETQLTVLAAQMQANPNCKVVITGGGGGSKAKEQRSWEHVNAVIEYMGDKHSISRDRFIFKYGENENENIVQCRPADVDEPGDSNVPPPHPNLK